MKKTFIKTITIVYCMSLFSFNYNNEEIKPFNFDICNTAECYA